MIVLTFGYALVSPPSVNLPRVTAQLEKLMGTNVVRLTDRKYMQELQRRIQQDYNVTLEKRISEREVRITPRCIPGLLCGLGWWKFNSLLVFVREIRVVSSNV